MVYFIDKFMHGRRNTLSVYDSSEGTLFLLFAAVLLSHSESPGVFALDNVDSALNPAMTRAFMEALHQSEGRAIQRFASINKSSRRRRHFCRKHSDGFERLERQCRHYRALVESLT